MAQRQLKILPKITMRTAVLEKYLSDIAREPMIDPVEEVNLSQKIKEGDKNAEEKLIKANLRFVVSVAKQYQNYAPLSDLINEGNSGLIIAARKFDASRGFKFISYSVWWIRQSILKYLQEYKSTIYLPFNQQKLLSHYKQFVESFEQEHMRPPTEYETCNELKIGNDKYQNIIYSSTVSHSLDEVFGEEETTTLLDVIPSSEETDTQVIKNSLKEDIKIAMSCLNKREREILTLHFGLDGNEPKNLSTIANEYDMTPENVRVIKEKAIKNMRKKLGVINHLMEYF